MENEIREFFHATAPQPGDETSFRLELNARLADVEKVRQYCDREIRRTRRTELAFLIAGVIVGGLVTAVIILRPEPLVRLWEALSGLFRPGGAEQEGVSPLGNMLFWLLSALMLLVSVILPIVFSRRRSGWRA
jgi:hypothetical protein